MSPIFKDGPCICGTAINCIRKEKKQHIPSSDTMNMSVQPFRESESLETIASHTTRTRNIFVWTEIIKDSSLRSTRCLPSHLARKRKTRRVRIMDSRSIRVGFCRSACCTSCSSINFRSEQDSFEHHSNTGTLSSWHIVTIYVLEVRIWVLEVHLSHHPQRIPESTS